MAHKSPAIFQRARATSDPSPTLGNSSAGPVHAVPCGLASSSAVTSTASTSASLSMMASLETLHFLRFSYSSVNFALGSPWPTMGSLLTWQLTRRFLHVRQALPLPPISQLQASFRRLQLSQGATRPSVSYPEISYGQTQIPGLTLSWCGPTLGNVSITSTALVP